MAEREQNSFVEAKLFELTAQAREAQVALTQASEEISGQIRDRQIGAIYDPAEFKRVLVGILNHPLAATIRSVREQLADIAVAVAGEISDGNLLEQIKKEHRHNRSAVESVAVAVKDGILPEDTLTLPNVDHFRERAQDYQLMLELYDQGIGLLPLAEKPAVSEKMADEAEQKRLLKMIHIRDKVKGDISIGDKKIHLRSKVSRRVFYRLVEDLKQPWGDSLGVHSQEVKSIAEKNGYTGKSPGRPISRLNEVFNANNLTFHVSSVKDPEDGNSRYYRIRERANA